MTVRMPPATGIMARAIDDLMRKIEYGLTIWPDGKRAIGPSNEPYVTFAVGRAFGDANNDDDLLAQMRDELLTYRKGCKFISWRIRPAFEDRRPPLYPAPAMLTVPNDWDGERIRALRCRVLMTAYPADQEWLRGLAEPNEFAELMHRAAA